MTTSGKMSHDLYDFMSHISNEMTSEYERIQKRATEDPGTAGDQGEENWATLLRDWLPASYEVVTKGRIISQEGAMSPQIDILVLKNCYPRKLLDKKVYLAAGVAAVFECKVTLKALHIKETIENCVKVKSLFAAREGTPYKELHSPIVYGLLAHSHSWKRKNSDPLEDIESKLIVEGKKNVNHPRKLLDLVCIADLAAWTSSIITRNNPLRPPGWNHKANKSDKDGSASTIYIGHTKNHKSQVGHFTPVGVLISYLSQKLAWENLEYRSLADYYRVTDISGSGKEITRKWNYDIYTSATRRKIELGLGLSNDVSWDEWSIRFP